MKLLWRCLLAFSLFMFNKGWSGSIEQTALIPFDHAPYPLTPSQANSFFEVNDQGRRGHNSPRGGLLWEDTTYSDNRVLVSIPPQFIGYRNPVIVVYLHGNESILERDVINRQQIPAQVAAADINAILIAPQFAVDAKDSNSGNFSQKNYFAKFITEAAEHISEQQENNRLKYQLKHASIILVAYSGGYLAAAHILEKGGVNNRIKGVILLDALYGQEDSFTTWLRYKHRQSFFVSAYTEPARVSNEVLQHFLRDKNIKFETQIPGVLLKNSITFLQLDENTVHKDLVTQAWTTNPLEDILRRVRIENNN